MLGGLVFAIVATSGCDSSTPSGTTSNCALGTKKCACYGNGSCDEGLVCKSDICVAANSDGAGGAGNVGGSHSDGGGQPNTTDPVTGNGGTIATTGSGGTPATGGAISATAGAPSEIGGAPIATGGAPVGTGGAPPQTGGTSPGTGGAPPQTGGAPPQTGGTSPGTGGAPVVSNVIDDFSTCDANINNASGRSGSWFKYADDDLNLTMGTGDPGTMWVDHSCALFVTAGCSVDPSTHCAFGGAGVELAGGSAYDLSSYDGVKVLLEAGNDVYFMLKTCTSSTCATDNSYGVWVTGSTGCTTRTIPFSTLVASSTAPVGSLPNLQYTKEIHFTIGAALTIPTGGFGMAIHKLELY